MKRSIRDMLFIFIGLFASAGLLWASRGDIAARLAGDVAYLNTLGRKAADARAMERLMLSAFRTTPDRIAALRAGGMGEGDVAAALAVVSRLPGRITDASLARITRLWKASYAGGWAGIVKTLGVNADHVALDVERVKPDASAVTGHASSTGVRKVAVPGLSAGGEGDEP